MRLVGAAAANDDDDDGKKHVASFTLLEMLAIIKFGGYNDDCGYNFEDVCNYDCGYGSHGVIPASVYTTIGGNAEWFVSRFSAGMIGVNIGIPVPREPFSFGGLYPSPSKYGDLDITGEDENEDADVEDDVDDDADDDDGR